jgi:hypothetical protein
MAGEDFLLHRHCAQNPRPKNLNWVVIPRHASGKPGLLFELALTRYSSTLIKITK